jgi:hypothetical protein
LGSIKEYRRILNKNRKEKLSDEQINEIVAFIGKIANQSVELYLNQEIPEG